MRIWRAKKAKPSKRKKMIITREDDSEDNWLVTAEGTSRRLVGAVPETVLTT